MLSRVRSRRAWIYVLSVLALLVPAGGIAYLGAVSYRNDRGAVAAQIESQRQAALAIAARIDHAVEDALDAIDRSIAAKSAGPGVPLARYWFWIDPEGRLRAPSAAPNADVATSLDRESPCRLEDCVSQQARIARLHVAERAEAAATWSEARRLYAQLAPFNDTGPDALIGLARVEAHLGEMAKMSAALDELDRRFADKTFEGMPVRLVTQAMRATTPEARLDLAEGIVDGHYGGDPIVSLGAIVRLRAELAGDLPAPLAARRAALDERLARLRTEARTAQGLADDVPELVRSATADWRSRPASRQVARTLIYRRRADGSVIGIAVDAPMLEAAAGHDAGDDVAPRVRPLVLPAGALVDRDLRELQGGLVQLGEGLPHLTLALVNPASDPDPLDESIRARSRRHVAYTSVLALALGLGLLAMIRGAARARELAQLKSDFVSTVSHELKTPLTSIRMFAEMLEQGVAAGDPGKMKRYQGVIVQESQRLGLLIANLLDYAQIERGTRRYTPSRENVAQLARHAVTTFETLRDPERGGRNPIGVEVSPEAMEAAALVDRDVVVQAILNLLANAAKYGGAEKAIDVGVGASAAEAWISVRDQGPGIPAHEQARIFREFYRAPEAYHSGVEGTGLGLALVKQHIEALGGSVEVASQVGHGATFTIRLPLAREVES